MERTVRPWAAFSRSFPQGSRRKQHGTQWNDSPKLCRLCGCCSLMNGMSSTKIWPLHLLGVNHYVFPIMLPSMFFPYPCSFPFYASISFCVLASLFHGGCLPILKRIGATTAKNRLLPVPLLPGITHHREHSLKWRKTMKVSCRPCAAWWVLHFATSFNNRAMCVPGSRSR